MALKFTSLYDFQNWLTFAGGVVEDDLFASDVDERLSRSEFSVTKGERKLWVTINKRLQRWTVRSRRQQKLINEPCMALNSVI